MMRNIAASLFVIGFAAVAAAQPASIPKQYDPSAEASFGGVVTNVIAVAGPDGTVGVHLDLKTATGTTVRVEVGPAMFIGMNNFTFYADDLILVKGAFVRHNSDLAVWARVVSKAGKTLELRSPDGTPRWPFATADDPDGCGVSHAPVRY